MRWKVSCVFTNKKNYSMRINNLIELNFNPVYTINIIIITYRGK